MGNKKLYIVSVILSRVVELGIETSTCTCCVLRTSKEEAISSGIGAAAEIKSSKDGWKIDSFAAAPVEDDIIRAAYDELEGN